MAYPDYKKDLLSEDFDVTYVLDRYFHSGESVVFGGAAPDAEAELKGEIARSLYSAFKTRVHPLQLIVCGSAHLGFSPVPDKLGRTFDPSRNDIDVAVISAELFESWWTELQSSGLDESVRNTVARDLFWGFINPAHVREVPEHGDPLVAIVWRLKDRQSCRGARETLQEFLVNAELSQVGCLPGPREAPGRASSDS